VIRPATRAERERAILEGRRGTIVFERSLYRSGVSGERFEELAVERGASVSLSNYRDHTWEISLPLKDLAGLDLYGDFVLLVIRLKDADAEDGSGWLEYPFGLYHLAFPKGEDSRMRRTYALTGKSLESLLLNYQYSSGYLVETGTGVLEAARGVLIDRGIPVERINFPPASEDEELASAYFADPRQGAEGIKPLRIVNGLMAAGGFFAVWTDASGRFTTRKVDERLERESAVTYGTTLDADRLVLGTQPFEFDGSSFANRIVVYNDDPDAVLVGGTPAPQIVGKAELRSVMPAVPEPDTTYVIDPDSEVSVDRYSGGEVQPDPVGLKNIANGAAAQKAAKARLMRAISMEEKRSLVTRFDPRRGPRESYRLKLYREDGAEAATGLFSVTNLAASLDFGSGARMGHEIGRGVRA
jgi:hypothetical protein